MPSIPFFYGSSMDSSFEATSGWCPPSTCTLNGPLVPRYIYQDETPEQDWYTEQRSLWKHVRSILSHRFGHEDYGRTARIVNLPPRSAKPCWYTFGIDLGLPIINDLNPPITQLGTSRVPNYTTRLVIRIRRPTVGRRLVLPPGNRMPDWQPTPQLEWLALASGLWEETRKGSEHCIMPMLYGYFDVANRPLFLDWSPQGRPQWDPAQGRPLWHEHTWYMHEHRPGIPLEQIFEYISAAGQQNIYAQISEFIKTIQMFSEKGITNIARDRPGHVRLETRRGVWIVPGSVDYRTMIIETFRMALEDAESNPLTRWALQTIPENYAAKDSLRKRLQCLLDDYSRDPTVQRVFESEGRQHVFVHGQLTFNNMVWDPETGNISLREFDDVCFAHPWHQVIISLHSSVIRLRDDPTPPQNERLYLAGWGEALEKAGIETPPQVYPIPERWGSLRKSAIMLRISKELNPTWLALQRADLQQPEAMQWLQGIPAFQYREMLDRSLSELHF